MIALANSRSQFAREAIGTVTFVKLLQIQNEHVETPITSKELI
jgi:hypothetical protein